MVHDLARWLPDRSIQVLHEWCSLELNTVVVDTGESPLEHDDLGEMRQRQGTSNPEASAGKPLLHSWSDGWTSSNRFRSLDKWRMRISADAAFVAKGTWCTSHTLRRACMSGS